MYNDEARTDLAYTLNSVTTTSAVNTLTNVHVTSQNGGLTGQVDGIVDDIVIYDAITEVPTASEIAAQDLQNQIQAMNATIITLNNTVTTMNATITTLNAQVSVIDTLVDYIDTFLNGLFVNYEP